MRAEAFATIGLILCAAASAHADDAGVPPAPEAVAAYDVTAELAWARGEWPEELAHVSLASPSQRLLSWVPKGRTATAFIFSDHYDCAPVELSRCEDEGCGYLLGKVIVGQRTRGRRVEREIYEIEIDDRISDEHDCTTSEVRDSHGQWDAEYSNCGCRGHHPPEPVLSHIDNSKAIYAGEPLVIEGVCAGPREWLACARGGDRLCHSCEEVGLEIQVDGWDREIAIEVDARSGEHLKRCYEPCPEPNHPKSERLRILNQHLRRRGANVTSSGGLPTLWRPSEFSDPSGIYKRKQDCLRDHRRERGATQR